MEIVRSQLFHRSYPEPDIVFHNLDMQSMGGFFVLPQCQGFNLQYYFSKNKRWDWADDQTLKFSEYFIKKIKLTEI